MAVLCARMESLSMLADSERIGASLINCLIWSWKVDSMFFCISSEMESKVVVVSEHGFNFRRLSISSEIYTDRGCGKFIESVSY